MDIQSILFDVAHFNFPKAIKTFEIMGLKSITKPYMYGPYIRFEIKSQKPFKSFYFQKSPKIGIRYLIGQY